MTQALSTRFMALLMAPLAVHCGHAPQIPATAERVDSLDTDSSDASAETPQRINTANTHSTDAHPNGVRNSSQPPHSREEGNEPQADPLETSILASSWLSELKNLNDARVHILSTEITSVPEWDLELPVLEFDLEDADSAEVLRCKAEYTLQLPDGSTLFGDEDLLDITPELKRWAWQEAKGQPDSCQLVSLSVTGRSFLDNPANAGTYRYILNPCQAKTKADGSTTKQCNHELALSEEITVEEGLNESLLAAFREGKRQEAAVTGLYMRLRLIAETLVRNRDLCVIHQAVNARSDDLWNNLLEIASSSIWGIFRPAFGGGIVVDAIAKNLFQKVYETFKKDSALPTTCDTFDQLLVEAQNLQAELKQAELQLEAAYSELSRQIQHTAFMRQGGGTIKDE